MILEKKFSNNQLTKTHHSCSFRRKPLHVTFVKYKVFQQLFCHTATFSTALFVIKSRDAFAQI